jgi:hypothetical protein
MADEATISTIGAIIAGFGVAMLFFRIQRELTMRDHDEAIWIPWADWLIVAATLSALLLVLLPVVVAPGPASLTVASAACAAALILVAGYVFAILAHYRVWIGKQRSGPRSNPEPAEKAWVVASTILAGIAFGVTVWLVRLRGT